MRIKRHVILPAREAREAKDCMEQLTPSFFESTKTLFMMRGIRDGERAHALELIPIENGLREPWTKDTLESRQGESMEEKKKKSSSHHRST